MNTLAWAVVGWQLAGIAVFTVGTIMLGIALRRKPERAFAERISRVSHLLYWVCLVIPGVLGFFYPGLTRFDRLVGVRPLPYRAAGAVLGLLVLLPGVYLSAASNAALKPARARSRRIQAD